MLFKLFRISCLLSLMAVMTNTAIAADRYLLNAGDVLEISVWNEDALQKQVVILPDGMIAFPLAGELKAQGQSVTDLQAALTKKLKKYLSDPVVTVSVKEVSGNTVHIMGKVKQPGAFAMNKNMDVVQALSLAGGLSPYAEENNIIVLRREGNKETVIPVYYADIKKGRKLTSNIILRSGDVIVIP